MTTIDDRPFLGKDLWAVILGGSSGFGLATARRLARAGLHLVLGHRDPLGLVQEELEPQWDWIRGQGVTLVTHNGNLFDDEERGSLLDEIERSAGEGGVHLFLHSIAAGSCKPIALAEGEEARRQMAAVRILSEALAAQGVDVAPDVLDRAIQTAFHERGCDALYPLARSRIPEPRGELSEEDVGRTLFQMGYDYLLWGRELAACGLLAPRARLMALTSQGSSVAWPGYGAVGAAKAALEATCRAMALELGPKGVRCLLVQAGITDTPAGNAIPNFDRMKARARLKSPYGRLTTPDDVAEAIYGLLLPSFDWANGAVIRIDGGEAIVGD